MELAKKETHSAVVWFIPTFFMSAYPVLFAHLCVFPVPSFSFLKGGFRINNQTSETDPSTFSLIKSVVSV